MWRVDQLFGVPFAEARVYIGIIGIVHTLFQIIVIYLMFFMTKTPRFYIDNFKLFSTSEAALIYGSLLIFYGIINKLALCFSAVFLAKKDKWCTLCWVISHGLLVIMYILAIIFHVTHLGYKFKSFPSSISTTVSAAALANGLYFLLWYAVLYEYHSESK